MSLFVARMKSHHDVGSAEPLKSRGIIVAQRRLRDPLPEIARESYGSSSGFAHDFSGIPARHAFSRAASGGAGEIPYRWEMESSFGEDFSGVRAYFGRSAALRGLNANAAASGERIAFGGSFPDKRLVAHELAHVVQGRRAGGAVRAAALSEAGDPAEREAESVASQVAEGGRVDVSSAPQAAIHRDIKDASLQVPLGHFEIDMTAVATAGTEAGEDGTLSFTPNDKAPDSKSIRLSQVVKTVDVSTGTDLDWSKDGSGSEANRNKMQTTASDGTHKTVGGETLKTIAKRHYGDPARFADIFGPNIAALAPTMTTADGDKRLPADLTLTIPKAVEGGFFVDHMAADPKAVVRTAKTDPEVPQDYVWPGEEIAVVNQHGSKSGKTIVAASLKDRPATPKHLQFTFQTVARSEDAGIHYGTVNWSFDADGGAGTVTAEAHSVMPGISDTFRSGVDEFNKFYKNSHTVMKGETLTSIAEKYYGDRNKWGEIFKANTGKIKDPDAIMPGMKLNIPIIGP
ncbi:MAG: DUF4157 domain-containing protein [Candidatus Kapaibacterium sp.]